MSGRRNDKATNWKIVVSERLERFPARPYSDGYGLLPMKAAGQTAVEYFLSAQRTRELILTGRLLPDAAIHITDLRRVATMFNGAQAADKPNWLQHVMNLGYPSHLLARAVTQQLAVAQTAIVKDDALTLKGTLDFLHDEGVIEMLDHFIESARGAPQLKEVGFAYVAVAGDFVQRLAVGSSDQGIEEIVGGLNQQYPMREAPWGLVGLWLVHDVEQAQDSINDVIKKSGGPVSGSHEAICWRARKVQSKLEAALIASDNLILSPWHVEDDAALERLGFISPRCAMTASEPMRNVA